MSQWSPNNRRSQHKKSINIIVESDRERKTKKTVLYKHMQLGVKKSEWKIKLNRWTSTRTHICMKEISILFSIQLKYYASEICIESKLLSIHFPCPNFYGMQHKREERFSWFSISWKIWTIFMIRLAYTMFVCLYENLAKLSLKMLWFSKIYLFVSVERWYMINFRKVKKKLAAWIHSSLTQFRKKWNIKFELAQQ